MKLRRAQPWLGTLVEIEAGHRSSRALQAAIDAAFAAIAKVHHLMSRQAPDSDVTRINQAAAGESVLVHPWTARALRSAQRLWQLSAGSFDIVEPSEAPANTQHLQISPAGSRCHVAILKLHACRISLDGIAKGFAVDQAIHRLRRHGANSGMVNAGGDLRCFGPQPFAVLLRRPLPGNSAPHWQLSVRDCAVATSGAYFGTTLWNVTDPPACESWTVMAPTATTADALTKVVFCQGGRSAKLLQRLAARAWHLDGNSSGVLDDVA